MRLHWFLSATPGKGRRIRSLVGWLGPTWSASPVRRLVQVAALVTFAWIFFYVCWPYTARPAQTWPGWTPEEVDAATGQVRLTVDTPPIQPIPLGAVVYVSETAAGECHSLGVFHVEEAEPKRLLLRLQEPFSPEQVDQLSASFGPWALSTKPADAWPSHYAENLLAKEYLPAEIFLALDPLASLSTALAARAWVWSLWFAIGLLVVCLVVPRSFCGYLCPMGTLIDLSDWIFAVVRRLLRAGPRIITPARKIVTSAAVFVRRIGNPSYRPQDLLSCRGNNRTNVAFRSAKVALLSRSERRQSSASPVSMIAAKRSDGLRRIKYYLLAAVLGAALCGVLLSGFVSAIPLVTRGMAFIASPIQMGLTRGWHQVPPLDAARVVSIVLFVAVLGLGWFGPRLWCRYLCPSGAVFSIANFFRLTERKVQGNCINCGRCREICPFDAIQSDFSTRTTDCTFCQVCGGVCPTKAIAFVPRWERNRIRSEDGPRPSAGRRQFLTTGTQLIAGAMGGAAGALAVRVSRGQGAAATPVVRPPGSVPEPQFLQLCIRCGECFQACPNNVLQPLGLELGFDGLWTPRVTADWSGCESSCSNCGQVCPTGAIRALPLEEKRVARIGLAVVDKLACLPYAGKQECQVCVDECRLAGYNAIEFIRVGTQADESGQPVPDTGYLAPTVVADRCVGCGLCQTRCRTVNVKSKGLLLESAIQVQAGEGKEDRLRTGSYAALRREEKLRGKAEPKPLRGDID